MTGPGAAPALLHDFFARAARRDPDRVAIDVPPGHARAQRELTTYGELDRLSANIAARLTAVVRGECVVAILLPRNSHRLYACQLGVLRAGAAYTCIDPAFPDEHARHLLTDSGAVALITDAAGRARAALTDSLPAERLLDAELLAMPAPAQLAQPAQPWLGPESLAYLIYTSGSTGKPKGVMIEHRSIANLVESDLESFHLSPGDRVAQGSSPSYDSAIEEAWLAWAAGATLVLMDDAASRLGPDLVHWLRGERISVLCPPPTLLRTMGCADPSAALPDLRLLYVGGEALPRDVADSWARGRQLVNGYGPTECTVTALRAQIRAGEPITIGQPVPGALAWALREEAAGHLAEVAPGDLGELCIGGVGLARGYCNQAALTTEKFPLHPEFGRIYRTGDLVRRDSRGDFHFEGRIDTQVKLRGYRIELGAIEAEIAACPGVREAACCVQPGGAAGAQVLAAFIVPQSSGEPPRIASVKEMLRRTLPAYMVPSHIAILERLPTTVGGKLDRRQLPVLTGRAQRSAESPIAPRDELERRIARAVQTALGMPELPSIDGDFFEDEGGDSLAAAGLISALRSDPLTAALAVRDVYEARTIAGLAQRAAADERAAESGPADTTAVPGTAAEPTPARSYPLLVTAAQTVALLIGLYSSAAVAWFGCFEVLPAILSGIGLRPFILVLPLVAGAALLAYLALSLGLAVLAKRVLIGSYQPGLIPVWGALYLRHWVVLRIVHLVPWGLLQGTVFLNAALRALGARIGRRVHIHRGVDLLHGGWDLLRIDDDATLSQDAALHLAELQAGSLVIGAVSVGAGAVVDVRASMSPGSELGAGAHLCALSWLQPGAVVPAGRLWSGVPAADLGAAPLPPPLPPLPRQLAPALHGALLILCRFALGVCFALPMLGLALAVSHGAALQGDGLLAWLEQAATTPAALVPILGLAVASVPAMLLLEALALRALGSIPAGSIGRWSPGYLRVWLKAGVVQSASDWLSGTLFWPWWLRLAGMRIGRNCEISTIIDIVPEQLEVGDECFLADGIYLGGPRVAAGVVTIARTRLGAGTFLGNHVVVAAGRALPDRILLGVCTPAHDPRIHEGSSWFGHPAFELPRREVVQLDRKLTHEPGPLRYANRVFWEALRFALPCFPVVVALAWYEAVAATAGASYARVFGYLLPAITAGAIASLCLMVLLLKWVLLGRVRPGQHALWSCWCSRWDFLYVAWGQYARAPLAALEGTLLLGWYLRAMGARIGRRVVLGGGFAQVVDPDMLELDDDSTVACHFQAHSFEDRVLKIGRVRIGRAASVAAEAVLLYGAEIGAGTLVAPHSVVMKNERLLPGQTYAGCPTRPVAQRLPASKNPSASR